MILIAKGLGPNDIPPSLRSPFKQNFHPGNITRASKTTSKRRNELIRNGAFIDSDPYNSRYKSKDVKASLKRIYNNKCAFCEQRVEQFHVEHYRPKQTYYWLAFSWDNLLSACSGCNTHKGVNFRINGSPSSMVINLANLKNINTLSGTYNIQETPDLINPETTDPSGQITFAQDGGIGSANPKFVYTIDVCQIDRTYLKDNRMKILNDLRDDLKFAFVEFSTKAEQAASIKTVIERFIAASKDPKNEFIAFREYVINNWLAVEIKNAKD